MAGGSTTESIFNSEQDSRVSISEVRDEHLPAASSQEDVRSRNADPVAMETDSHLKPRQRMKNEKRGNK